jgi:hypothetical protein
MAKTYNTFTDVATGEVLTATNFNNVLENVGNYRVPPMCRAVRSTNQSFASGALAAVNFDAEDGLRQPNYIEAQTAGCGINASLQIHHNGTGSGGFHQLPDF